MASLQQPPYDEQIFGYISSQYENCLKLWDMITNTVMIENDKVCLNFISELCNEVKKYNTKQEILQIVSVINTSLIFIDKLEHINLIRTQLTNLAGYIENISDICKLTLTQQQCGPMKSYIEKMNEYYYPKFTKKVTLDEIMRDVKKNFIFKTLSEINSIDNGSNIYDYIISSDIIKRIQIYIPKSTIWSFFQSDTDKDDKLLNTILEDLQNIQNNTNTYTYVQLKQKITGLSLIPQTHCASTHATSAHAASARTASARTASAHQLMLHQLMLHQLMLHQLMLHQLMLHQLMLHQLMLMQHQLHKKMYLTDLFMIKQENLIMKVYIMKLKNFIKNEFYK